MMFSKKSEESTGAAAPASDQQAAVAAPVVAPVAAAVADQPAPVLPARRTVVRPEVVRRQADYSGPSSEPTRSGGYGDGKKLIVGRDIALSGTISACSQREMLGRSRWAFSALLGSLSNASTRSRM